MHITDDDTAVIGAAFDAATRYHEAELAQLRGDADAIEVPDPSIWIGAADRVLLLLEPLSADGAHLECSEGGGIFRTARGLINHSRAFIKGASPRECQRMMERTTLICQRFGELGVISVIDDNGNELIGVMQAAV